MQVIIHPPHTQRSFIKVATEKNYDDFTSSKVKLISYNQNKKHILMHRLFLLNVCEGP